MKRRAGKNLSITLAEQRYQLEERAAEESLPSAHQEKARSVPPPPLNAPKALGPLFIPSGGKRGIRRFRASEPAEGRGKESWADNSIEDPLNDEEDLIDRIQQVAGDAVDAVAPGFRIWLSDRRQRAEAIRFYRSTRSQPGSSTNGSKTNPGDSDPGEPAPPSRAVPKLKFDLARRSRISWWKMTRPVIRWQRRSPPRLVLAAYLGLGTLVSISVTAGLLIGSSSTRSTREKESPPDHSTGNTGVPSTGRSKGYSGRILSIYGGAVPRGASSEPQQLSQTAPLITSARLTSAMNAVDQEAAARGTDPAAWHQAGVVALAAGDRRKARDHFREALKFAPQSQATIFNLAQVEFENGDYREAARLLAIFRKSDPRHRIAAFREVLCGILLGKEAAIPQDVLPENSVSGLCARAALAARDGDPSAARTLMEKARATGNTSRFEADLRVLDIAF